MRNARRDYWEGGEAYAREQIEAALMATGEKVFRLDEILAIVRKG